MSQTAPATISAPPGLQAGEAAIRLPRRALVEDGSGPQLLYDRDGALRDGNELGQLLARHEASGARIRHLAFQAQVAGKPLEALVALPGPPQRAFQIRAWPVMLDGDSDGVWISGSETSARDQLIDALGKSRAMFKDLAEAGGDFCWCVSETGVFAYVSPAGALGWEAWELNGQSPAILGEFASQLFCTHEPLQDSQIWVTDRSGERRCLSIFARPQHEGERWTGARGIARDITLLKRAEESLAFAQRCEILLHTILQTVHGTVEPSRMLKAAAGAVRSGIAADSCTIVRRTDETTDGAALAASEQVHVPCRIGDDVVGELMLSRNTPFSTAERDLVDRIAGHVAMVIAQADHLDDLERLSLTDSLTGLRNRRSFDSELAGRLARIARHGGRGCLMMVDLDYFKDINDTHGHQAGDKALSDVAAAMQVCVRTTDLLARLGGDEFAMWLEDADVLGAERVAAILRSRMALICQQWPGCRLSLSFGIAAARTGAEDITTLVKRADEALYIAKKRGRDGVAIWGEEE